MPRFRPEIKPYDPGLPPEDVGVDALLTDPVEYGLDLIDLHVNQGQDDTYAQPRVNETAVPAPVTPPKTPFDPNRPLNQPWGKPTDVSPNTSVTPSSSHESEPVTTLTTETDASIVTHVESPSSAKDVRLSQPLEIGKYDGIVALHQKTYRNGRRHWYGLDEQGNSRHLSNDAILKSYMGPDVRPQGRRPKQVDPVEASAVDQARQEVEELTNQRDGLAVGVADRLDQAQTLRAELVAQRTVAEEQLTQVEDQITAERLRLQTGLHAGMKQVIERGEQTAAQPTAVVASDQKAEVSSSTTGLILEDDAFMPAVTALLSPAVSDQEAEAADPYEASKTFAKRLFDTKAAETKAGKSHNWREVFANRHRRIATGLALAGIVVGLVVVTDHGDNIDDFQRLSQAQATTQPSSTHKTPAIAPETLPSPTTIAPQPSASNTVKPAPADGKSRIATSKTGTQKPAKQSPTAKHRAGGTARGKTGHVARHGQNVVRNVTLNQGDTVWGALKSLTIDGQHIPESKLWAASVIEMQTNHVENDRKIPAGSRMNLATAKLAQLLSRHR